MSNFEMILDVNNTAVFEGLFTEVASKVTTAVWEEARAEGTAVWDGAKNTEAAFAYLKQLQKRYGTIQVLGQNRPKPLGQVFTDVYLHERPTHSYGLTVDALGEWHAQDGRLGLGGKKGERVNGLAFAQKTERLMVLGKPGAGKTTFMKYLTMQAAAGQGEYVPIFVSLNALSRSGLSILDYMAQQFDVCGFPEARPFVEQLLREGKGLVLFDGLDEVAKEERARERLTSELDRFMAEYDGSRFVITCRIAASEYTFDRFVYVEMADFTAVQVTRFVQNWFTEESGKQESFLADLAKEGNKGVREMTTSPLLLTMLCIQYDSNLSFLPSRAEMYEEAITILLKKWDSSRNIKRDETVVKEESRYKGLSPHRKIQLLSRLAHETFGKGELFIKQKWLEDKIARHLSKMPGLPPADEIDGALILTAMESQHGMLVARALRIYSFSHLTFQEYFTARYIVDHQHERVAGSGETVLEALVTAARVVDKRWREVFLFVAELLPKGDRFVLLFVDALKQVAGSREQVQLFTQWVENRSAENCLANRSSHSRLEYFQVALSSISYHFRDNPDPSYFYTILSMSIIDMGAPIKISMLSMACDIIAQGGVSLKFTEDFRFGLIGAIQIAKEIKWQELEVSLQRFSILKPDDSIWIWQSEAKKLQETLNEIVCQGWIWQTRDREDFEVLTRWFDSHKLLFACLDRAVLDGLERDAFEDEHLFMPPDEVGYVGKVEEQVYDARDLLRRIEHCFPDEAGLRRLCFEMGLGYDQLDGGNTKAKGLALVKYAERRKLLGQLWGACAVLCPDEFV